VFKRDKDLEFEPEPTNYVAAYEGLEVGDFVIYYDRAYRIFSIDTLNGIKIVPFSGIPKKQAGREPVLVLDHLELTKLKAGKLLYGENT